MLKRIQSSKGFLMQGFSCISTFLETLKPSLLLSHSPGPIPGGKAQAPDALPYSPVILPSPPFLLGASEWKNCQAHFESEWWYNL